MKRRQFMMLLGGAVTATWPLAGRAQQSERVRRIGVLLPFDNADDPQVRQLWPAFKQRLRELGWVEGRNIQLDVHFTTQDIDRIRVGAMVVENLAAREPARALGLLRETLAAAQRSGLPDDDPMHRAVAVASHNLACALEETTDRCADERALMILAAQASREHWERAGTWLEVERAEYRLAMTWLQAGDLAQARRHAQACLDIVAANDGAALERLFGWEALGLVERAAGHTAGHAHALAMARAPFTELSADDQGWCAGSIEKLAAFT